MDQDYRSLLAVAKQQISEAQIKLVTASNKELLYLYWKLGNLILHHQDKKGWGAKVIDLLSADLKKELPNQKGFSPRNLKYMRKFALEYQVPVLKRLNVASEKLLFSNPGQQQVQKIISEIVQQPVAQITADEFVQPDSAQIEDQFFYDSIISKISWSHHVVLLDKEPHLGKRLWYIHNAIEQGASRNTLIFQIESGLFERQVKSKKLSNFQSTMPPVKSDFANYLLKDPYIFDFVNAKEKADERNIEEQLANHVTKFLLELGKGFAFIGRQMRFEIGGKDFFLDLVFYHTRLKCHVVVELKAREFQPGDASQLNFYVNLANDFLKSNDDHESIGLLLCKGKNDVVAEYSLKGFSNSIGISDYQLSKVVPEELQSELPQIEDLEKEFKE
jgi:predicted nuclease of restriction endonuclease-like (RecB) superfamily